VIKEIEVSIYTRVALFALLSILIPAALFAQTGDICSKLPVVESLRSVNPNVASAGTNSDIIVQQMRERAETQARLEKERANWVIQMIPVKYLDSATTLKALCIFPAEIVPQTAQHLISVRAPAPNMTAIVDAIKRLDVPQVGPKNVEWTIYVLVASDLPETLRAIPANLNAVVEQLKGVLPYKQFYLLDTLFGTTADGNFVNLSGGVRGLSPAPGPGFTAMDTSSNFAARISVGTGESASASVHMSQLMFRLNAENVGGAPVMIATDVDIPVGKQVVVGKSTSGDRAYILVVNAKILN
jgi:hypothetical protein